MKKLLFAKLLTLVTLLCSGCATDITIKNFNKSENEAIFIGKFEAFKRDSQNIGFITLSIDGSNYTPIDEYNYFYFKLPLGKHFITNIETRSNSFTFLPYDTLMFYADTGGIYYIGDIKIFWKDYSSFAEGAAPFAGGLGAIAGKAEPLRKKRGNDIVKKTPVFITDNFDKTKERIISIFQETKGIKVEKGLLKSNYK